MKELEYYRKLTSAAKKTNKSELEVYKSVSKSIDEILNRETEQDKCLVLKALIAYVEGKSVHSWFTAIIPISYALIIGAVSLMPDVKVADIIGIIIMFLFCAAALAIVAVFNLDFERKVVVCVLKDRLNELESKSEFDINIAVVETQDKKQKGKKKSKNK
nr:MAG TPA: hypothetical protein [Caudoviricetes sp.]